jgi:transposase-like protein DUF772
VEHRDEADLRAEMLRVDELDLAALGFAGMTPAATGRPAYHPSTLLKIYLYGYLNRVQSSRRLERETQRNIELMWLGRLEEARETVTRLKAVVPSVVHMRPPPFRKPDHRELYLSGLRLAAGEIE